MRPNRPYAAGLAAQLSQRRKQLEDRAKEKLKLEKENVLKLQSVDSEGAKAELRSDSPSLKKRNEKKKFVIEIQDDDEQHETDSVATVDVLNGLPKASEITADAASVNDDDVSSSTTDDTSTSSSDTQPAQNDDCKLQTLDSQQAVVDSSAAKSASATLSLMNLPMPPVDSESDSEVTPVSADEP